MSIDNDIRGRFKKVDRNTAELAMLWQVLQIREAVMEAKRREHVEREMMDIRNKESTSSNE